MRMTTRIICATTIAGALLAASIPAVAAASMPVNGGGLVAASLRVSDVPPSFFNQNPSLKRSYHVAPQTNRYEMCVDKNGHKVFGAKPLQHANSTVPLSQTGSGNNITASIAVSSDIYGYASPQAASIHWNRLIAATSRCAPIINKPVEIDGARVMAHVRQQRRGQPCTRGDVGLRCGFSIAQQVAVDVGTGAPSDLHIYVGGYSVYRMVGTTILRVQFANYTQASAAKSKIRPGWAAFTRTEAARIDYRVSRLPIR